MDRRSPASQSTSRPGRRARWIWGLVGAVSLTGVVRCRTPVNRVVLVVTNLGERSDQAPRMVPAEDDRSAPSGRSETVGVRPIEFSSGSDGVRLVGAGREVLRFSFAVRAVNGPVHEIKIRPAPLVGHRLVIPSSAMELLRVHAVHIDRWPGWHIRSIPPRDRVTDPLDVLVPLDAPRGGLPATMEPNSELHLYGEVRIPESAVGDIYRGSIGVTSAGREVAQLPVELTVWPFSLPVDQSLVALAELDHRSLLLDLERERSVSSGKHSPQGVPHTSSQPSEAPLVDTLQLFGEHRITPLLTALVPAARVTGSGMIVDWGRYDALVDRWLRGRLFPDLARPRYVAFPVGPLLPDSSVGSKLGTRMSDEVATRYFQECVDHFQSRNWLEQAVMVDSTTLESAVRDRVERSTGESAPEVRPRGHSGVEVGSMKEPGPVESTVGVESLRRLHALVHGEGVSVPLVSRLPCHNLRSVGWTGPLPTFERGWVDIWSPPARHMDHDCLEAERTKGKRIWFRPDDPPFSGSLDVRADASSTRCLGWQTLSVGAEAIDLGSINQWPATRALTGIDECHAEDPRVLLYPGSLFGLGHPVASLRLKRIRDAMQDVAYVDLLRERGLGYLVDALQPSLSGRVGSEAYRAHFADGRFERLSRRESWYETARMAMGEVLAESHGRSDIGSSEAVRTATWRRLMLDSRRLQLEINGSRIRRVGVLRDDGLDFEFVVEVLNEGRVPVNVTLNAEGTSRRWPVVEATSVSVPQGGSRAVRLTGRGGWPDMDPNGNIPFVVRANIDDGAVLTESGRLSFMAATAAPRGIRVDGDLSDWPMVEGNTASGFELVTPDSRNWNSADGRSPSQETWAFVMRDESHLYVGILARGNRRFLETRSHRNSVTYDHLVPVGEELVELLIDPFNSGSRSPTDIHQIVVKPDGAWLAAIGVDAGVHCGAVRFWGATVSVATLVEADRWYAEVRIPLDGFGVVTPRDVIWGFNVTRFDVERQEYSTWSGAWPNAYDPVSLGNLYLP